MAGTPGKSGRRPKPTARKELAGNPGKRALNKDEPVFTPLKGVAGCLIGQIRTHFGAKIFLAQAHFENSGTNWY